MEEQVRIALFQTVETADQILLDTANIGLQFVPPIRRIALTLSMGRNTPRLVDWMPRLVFA
jgi:hypothetical protein